MEEELYQLKNETLLLKIERDGALHEVNKSLALLRDLSQEMDKLQTSIENGVLRTSELEIELGSCGKALQASHEFLSNHSHIVNGISSSGISSDDASIKEANERAFRAETHLNEVAADFKLALERANEAASSMESNYKVKIHTYEAEIVDLSEQCLSFQKELESVIIEKNELVEEERKKIEIATASSSSIRIELESALQLANERVAVAESLVENERINFEEKFSQLLSASAAAEALRMSERDTIEGLLSSTEGSLLATEAKLHQKELQIESLQKEMEDLKALTKEQLETLKSSFEKEMNTILKSKQDIFDEALFNASNEKALLEDKIKSQSIQHINIVNDFKSQLRGLKEAEIDIQQRAARAIAASAQVARAAQEEARSIKTSTSLAAEVRHLAASHREHIKAGGASGTVKNNQTITLLGSKSSQQVSSQTPVQKAISTATNVKSEDASKLTTSSSLPFTTVVQDLNKSTVSVQPPLTPSSSFSSSSTTISAASTVSAVSTPTSTSTSATLSGKESSGVVVAPLKNSATLTKAVSPISSKTLDESTAPPKPSTTSVAKPATQSDISSSLESSKISTTSGQSKRTTTAPTTTDSVNPTLSSVTKKPTWSEKQKLKSQT